MVYYVDAQAWKDGDGSKGRPFKHIQDAAAAARAGDEILVAPGIYREHVFPVRGGTDGSRLSFMGLPCPNLATGGGNFHSRFEYASIQEMEKCAETLIRIAAV